MAVEESKTRTRRKTRTSKSPTRIHSRTLQQRLPFLGQYSIGTAGQYSVDANKRIEATDSTIWFGFKELSASARLRGQSYRRAFAFAPWQERPWQEFRARPCVCSAAPTVRRRTRPCTSGQARRWRERLHCVAREEPELGTRTEYWVLSAWNGLRRTRYSELSRSNRLPPRARRTARRTTGRREVTDASWVS